MKSHVQEIDGLRAIAVVAVLLFHGFPDLLPGGFIGVDVFFVVSGYVIARTYGRRLLEGESSLKDFYIRRIRRLAPVYAVVLAVTTLAAFFILEPSLLKSYAISLFSQPFYAQNITFWSEGNYFLSPTDRPLLHTWSLAIEEQFYLLFGLGIVFGRRFPKLVLAGGVLVGIASYAVGASGFLDPQTVFFLLPTRVWEFMCGIGAWALASRIQSRDARGGELALGAIAFLAIVVSLIAFHEESPFPGVQAILACAGTSVLMVLFEVRPSKAYAFFRTRIARRIGELSYGLYLWHWPGIALLATYLGRPLKPLEASVVLMGSYVVSELTYRTVEDPFRRRKRLGDTPMLLRAWVTSSVFFIAVGGLLFLSNGALFRFSEPVRSYYAAAQDKTEDRCTALYSLRNPTDRICPANDLANAGRIENGILLLGDSHSKHLVPLMQMLGTEMDAPVYISRSTCDLDEYGIKRSKNCSEGVFNSTLSEATRKGVQHVIVSSLWDEGRPDYDAMLPRVQSLADAGFQVILSEVVPYSTSLDPSAHAAAIRSGTPRPTLLTRAEYLDMTATQRNAFARMKREGVPNLAILSPGQVLCPDEICRFETDTFAIRSDGSHLTKGGVRLLAPLYRAALQANTDATRALD